MNERPDRGFDDRRAPRTSRGEGAGNRNRDFDGQGPARGDRDSRPRRDHDSRPRRDGDFQPRREGGRDGGYQPRRDNDSRPRRNGDFQPRRDGDFQPRREGGRDGGYQPRRDNDSRPRREGGRDGGYQSRRDNDSRPRRDGDFHPRRDGDFQPRREGGHQPRRDNDSRPRRDGDFRPRRDGDFQPRREGGRDGGYQPRRDNDSRPRRDGDFRPRRDGDFQPRREGGRDGGYQPRRDNDSRPRRDGDSKPRRDGDFQPRRDGDFKPRREDSRDGGYPREDRAPYGRGSTRGGGRSDRGGRDREFTEAERLQHELRPVRSQHDDPVIPEDITVKDLHPAARNELKTLQAEVQERVGAHLAMVAILIDEEPELAHQHAVSASRRAGRIPVARETLAITAYRIGDFALALRELRTHRRLSGQDGHIALMVDCERGLGRPEKAIETGLEVDPSRLETDERVNLAIAMSGARLDLGQTQQALFELEIPELNPKKAFSWSPDLFGAYAAVLEDLGRLDEARTWQQHSDRAAGALQDHLGALDELEVIEIRESYVPEDHDDFADDDADADASIGADVAGVAGADDAADSSAETDTASTDDAESEPTADADVDAEVAAKDHKVETAFEATPESVVATPEEEAAIVADLLDAEYDAHDASETEMSVEDEVAELLAEAGIVDAPGAEEQEPVAEADAAAAGDVPVDTEEQQTKEG